MPITDTASDFDSKAVGAEAKSRQLQPRLLLASGRLVPGSGVSRPLPLVFLASHEAAHSWSAVCILAWFSTLCPRVVFSLYLHEVMIAIHVVSAAVLLSVDGLHCCALDTGDLLCGLLCSPLSCCTVLHLYCFHIVLSCLRRPEKNVNHTVVFLLNFKDEFVQL